MNQSESLAQSEGVRRFKERQWLHLLPDAQTELTHAGVTVRVADDGVHLQFPPEKESEVRIILSRAAIRIVANSFDTTNAQLYLLSVFSEPAHVFSPEFQNNVKEMFGI